MNKTTLKNSININNSSSSSSNNNNNKIIKKPLNITQFQIINIINSILIITLPFVYIYYFNNNDFNSIGKLCYSPIIHGIIVGETIRAFINKQIFKLELNPKDLSTFSSTTNNGNNRSKKKQQTSPTITSTLMEFIKSTIIFFLCILFYGFICIIMGAPIYSHYQETITLATILTIYTMGTMCLYLSAAEALQFIFCDNFELNTKLEITFFKFIKYNGIGVLIGAWAGSIVAPLDWDRDWQQYPIPNIIGALAGFTFTNLHCLGTIGLNLFFRLFKNKEIFYSS